MTAQQTEKIQKIDLRGRDFIEFTDYTAEEIRYLLDLAIEIKGKQKAVYRFNR